MMESLVVKNPKIKFHLKEYEFHKDSISEDGRVNFGYEQEIKENTTKVMLTALETPIVSQYTFEKVKRVNGVDFFMTGCFNVVVNHNNTAITVGFSGGENKFTNVFCIDEKEGRYLLINGSKSKIVSMDFLLEENITLPTAKYAEIFANRLFLCDKNQIKITDIVSYNKLKQGQKTIAEINLRKNDGIIKGLFSLSNCLIILTEKTVYSISLGFNVEDLKIRPIGSLNGDYVEESHVVIGNQLFVKGEKNLYRITNGKIDCVEIPSEYLSKATGYCGGYKRYYITPHLNGKALYYDTVNKKFGLFDSMDGVSDCGDVLVDRWGGLYKLSEQTEMISSKTRSEYYKDYLETFRRKYFTEITVLCKGQANLELSTDLGKRNILISQDIDGGRVSLTGSYLAMKINNSTSDFELEKARIKYRVFE